jgi:hypothetical protein
MVAQPANAMTKNKNAPNREGMGRKREKDSFSGL